MSKNSLLFLLIALSSITANAQSELSTQLIPGLLQQYKTNPALTPDDKLVIGLPSVFVNYFHTAGSITNLLEVDNKVATLNVQHLLENTKETNFLRVNLEFETFNIHYRINDFFALNLNHAVKSNNYLKYDKNLPAIFWQGNAQFIDQTVSFGPDQHSFAYNEFGLGGSFKFGKVMLGAKAKLLLGIGDVSTDKTEASLYTDPDIYQLTLDTDYRINASTFDEILLLDSLNGFNAEYGFEEVFAFKDFNADNIGYAFDLGINFAVSEKLNIALSAIDIGKIDWNANTKNFYSNGNFTYEGLNLSGLISGDAVSIEGAVDTLESVFQLKESANKYSTALPTKFYLSANYQATDKFNIGGLFYNEIYRGENFSAFAISGNLKVSNAFQFGAVYSVKNDTYDNLGFNFKVDLGPVQLYGMTDNVFGAFKSYNSENINLRLGLNLVFGRNKNNSISEELE